ncbi:hypothetical protein HDU96_010093 [Phlyctochytrium bullatum]|nr:hypothetical protein HDU96_010093 [Phlyctochytrium bullatum]
MQTITTTTTELCAPRRSERIRARMERQAAAGILPPTTTTTTKKKQQPRRRGRKAAVAKEDDGLGLLATITTKEEEVEVQQLDRGEVIFVTISKPVEEIAVKEVFVAFKAVDLAGFSPPLVTRDEEEELDEFEMAVAAYEEERFAIKYPVIQSPTVPVVVTPEEEDDDLDEFELAVAAFEEERFAIKPPVVLAPTVPAVVSPPVTLDEEEDELDELELAVAAFEEAAFAIKYQPVLPTVAPATPRTPKKEAAPLAAVLRPRRRSMILSTGDRRRSSRF